MRISDWSSDVCSSDLLFRHPIHPALFYRGGAEPEVRDDLAFGQPLLDLNRRPLAADIGHPAQPFPGAVVEQAHGLSRLASHHLHQIMGGGLRQLHHDSRGKLRLDEPARRRSEEHTSELQSLMRTPYAVFC